MAEVLFSLEGGSPLPPPAVEDDRPPKSIFGADQKETRAFGTTAKK